MRPPVAAALALVAMLVAASTASGSSPAGVLLGERPLHRGDRGADVRALQRVLTRLRLRTHVDGVFGRRTAARVRAYERRERLRRDGRVSRGQARGMLRRAGLPYPPPAATEAVAPTPVASPVPVTAAAFTPGRPFGGAHQGVDLLAPCGTPLTAPVSATVAFIGHGERAGHYVVAHLDATGEDLVLMHLERETPLRAGDAVPAGGVVGAVGRTGNATTCHVHVEIWTAPGWYRGGAPRDPAPDLASWRTV